jgi:phosphopantothenoylcysteine decarboxylase/phosphopantothenate--cysteine ligase
LKADGIKVIQPAEGDMACGEFGPGRLPEPQDIVDQLSDLLK